jgi:hypothetical protein
MKSLKILKKGETKSEEIDISEHSQKMIIGPLNLMDLYILYQIFRRKANYDENVTQ